MAAVLTVATGRTEKGTIRERLTLTLLWWLAWVFVPLNYRGFWRISRLVCRITSVPDRQWVKLPSGLTYSIDPGDPYWNRLVSPRFSYEPELDFLLQQFREIPYQFIDCGANMGFWSCAVASSFYGGKPVISVEPLTDNFTLLEANLQANHLSAACHHRAVSDQSGQKVTLYKPGGHASVSIIAEPDTSIQPHETVETLSLDSLLSQVPEDKLILLKLDVEGVEVQALKGAARLLERQPLIFYEDHGNDPASRVSDYILSELGYQVFYISESLQLVPIQSLEALPTIKTDPAKGYNFLALADSSPWQALLPRT